MRTRLAFGALGLAVVGLIVIVLRGGVGSGSTWLHARATGEWVSVQGRGLAAEDPRSVPAHRAPHPRSGRAGRAPRASLERGRNAFRSTRCNKPIRQAPRERG